MKFNPEIHHRRSVRLQDYDYSQDGSYFITICVQNKTELFGNIVDGEMILNDYGNFAKKCWLDLPKHYINCILDEFIIMPNHIHGIIKIENCRERFETVPYLKPFPAGKRHGLSEIIRGFKTFSSRNINKHNEIIHFQWQKSFYDHIIRNEISLNNIREYIKNNPLKWAMDSREQFETVPYGI